MLDNTHKPCQSPTVTDADPPIWDRAPSAERPRWFCARTLPNAERYAAQEIALAGYETFLPTIYRPPSPARRYSSGSVRPARPARVEPMFSRYVFVRFALTDPWQAIRRMWGIDRFLTASQADPRPLAMPPGAIDWVRSMVSDNGCQYPTAAKRQLPLIVGSRARLTQGSLADHVGICAYSDGRRVRLLMDILGRAVTVTADRDSVEAAEPAGE